MMVYDQIFDPICQGESSDDYDDGKIDLKFQDYHADDFLVLVFIGKVTFKKQDVGSVEKGWMELSRGADFPNE